MAEELQILTNQGDRLLLTVSGMRTGSPGAVMDLRATLGGNVLANLPLPKGPALPEAKGKRRRRPKPKVTAGPLREYTERSSLTELIRRSVKALQDGHPGPVTGAAVVPGGRKKQEKDTSGKRPKLITTTVPVPEQDWRYSWSISWLPGTAPGTSNKD